MCLGFLSGCVCVSHSVCGWVDCPEVWGRDSGPALQTDRLYWRTLPTQHSFSFPGLPKGSRSSFMRVLGLRDAGPAALVKVKPPFLVSYRKGVT